MTVLSLLLEPQGVLAGIGAVAAAIVGYLVFEMVSRPHLTAKTPARLPGYPLVGVPEFFSARTALFDMGTAISKTGQFSFFFGKHPIVGITGESGRKTYFETKSLNMMKGYETLFVQSPKVDIDHGPEEFGPWFNRSLKKMLSRDAFVSNLDVLTSDVRNIFKDLMARPGKKMMNPYDDLYRMVYQLTMRTVGCDEIAENRELGDRTLQLFESFEKLTSPARMVLPWLPTPSYIRRMSTGAKLFFTFDNIVKERKRTGVRRNDALQHFLDQGATVALVIKFVMSALFAGQLNSGINAAAMMVFAAQYPEWKARLRREVDGVIAKHRAGEDEDPIDILARLDLDAWETEFPLIDVALKETIRLEIVGTSFRKNTGSEPIRIQGTDEEIPPGAFAVYLLDDVHMNPEIYPNPTKWDPGRFLPDRAEDKKVSHGFLGWGVARHPCLGMKFAKLEMNLIAAHFLALFDFHLCDSEGNPVSDPVPIKSRTRHSAHKPDKPVFLRYEARRCWTGGHHT